MRGVRLTGYMLNLKYYHNLPKARLHQVFLNSKSNVKFAVAKTTSYDIFYFFILFFLIEQPRLPVLS